MSFKPWLFSWKTGVSYQLEQIGQYQPHLPLFLENHPKVNWKYCIKLDETGSSLFILIEQNRNIIPIRPKMLRKTLLGILISMDLKGKFVKSLNLDKNWNYYGISSNHKLPDLQTIAVKLEKFPSNIILLLDTYAMENNNRNSGISVFKIDLKIGISADHKHQVPIIKSFIKSLGKGIILGKTKPKIIIGSDIHRILQLPKLATMIKPSASKYVAPPSDYDPLAKFGHVLVDNQMTSPFGINAEDLAQGGIICGGIGTGKTTLRLHLMRSLLEQDVRVIDFDLKGDAPRYLSLGSQGLIIKPNQNFLVNPFSVPQGYSEKEYCDILFRAFLETVPHHETLSPPQKQLLNRSIELTVNTQGNARDFFHNILVIGNSEKRIIDNYQENTSQSLLVKFAWMQTNLGDIFWREENTLTESDYCEHNIFFDFSILVHTVPHKLIRFLMDLIMTRLMGSLRLEGNYGRNQKPRLVIFIDEAQILMPQRLKNDELSRLEETVSTLRYKGVAVLATGISASMMSHVLLDTGFIAQFRSESTDLLRNLGLFSTNESAIIPQLDRFTSIVRSNSMGNQGIHVGLDPFNEVQYDHNQYNIMIKLQYLPTGLKLPVFSLNFDSHWSAKIDSVMPEKLAIGGILREKLETEVDQFIRSDIKLFANLMARSALDKVVEKIYRKFQQMNLDSFKIIPLRFPEQFLLLVIGKLYLLHVIENRNSPLLNRIEKNYLQEISKMIGLLDREMTDIWASQIIDH